MADLPEIPNEIAQVRAPTSRVSPRQIAQPYQELAANLDKAGEAFNKYAVDEATKAGLKAVTRDDQGNVQIEHPPIFGDAAIAYSRAVKVAAVADGENDAKMRNIAMRQEHQDDPEGYLKAATEYKKKTLETFKAAGPQAQFALGQSIDSLTTQTYSGLLNTKQSTDLRNADASMTAGIASARDDAVAMARGGDTTSPAFQAAMGKVQALTNERVNNPRLAYPKERADYDLQHFDGEIKASGFLYHNDQIYKENGPQAALDEAKSILTDPSLKLTPAERESFYHKAVGEVHANEAIRKQDVGEARAAFSELSMVSASGTRVDPEQVEMVAEAFRRAGDPGSAARVYASFARKPLNDDFGRQPLGAQTTQLNAIRGANSAKEAAQFFVDRGYTPAAAAGIVGNLLQEGPLDPTLKHDGGIGLGISGWNRERLDALRTYAASQGKPATDFRTQLEFIDRELHGTEGATFQKLSQTKTPEDAAAAMINYFRPAGWTPGNPSAGHGFNNRVALARTVFDGSPPDMSGGPAQSAWLAANRQRTLDKDVRERWSTVMDDYNKKGLRPGADTVNEVISAFRATGNADGLEAVGHDMARIDLAEKISQGPLATQHAQITQFEAAGNAGTLPPGQAAVLTDLQRRNTAITKGLEDNPISTAVANFPDKFKTPNPLDMSNPQSLAAGLQQRAQIAQVAAQNWQTGPLSVLDKADLAQVQAALDNPDPKVKGDIFRAISTLPEGPRNATLAKIAGSDPQRFVQAAAGSMISEAPDVAQSIFRGQSAMKADKRYDPESADKKSYQVDIDKELPATTFTLADRTDPTGAYGTMQGMVKARYADLSAQAGKTDYSADRLKQAVSDVTGGVLKHNDGNLIAPARGMPQRTFDGVMQSVTNADLAGVTTLGGQPVTAEYLRGSAQLESVGDGRYQVKLGADPMRPIYAYTRDPDGTPQKFILDLRGRKPGPLPGKPGIEFWPLPRG